MKKMNAMMLNNEKGVAVGMRKIEKGVVVKTKNAVLGPKKTKGTMNSIWKNFSES